MDFISELYPIILFVLGIVPGALLLFLLERKHVIEAQQLAS